MEHSFLDINTLIFDLYWTLAKFTFYLEGQTSKKMLPVQIVYHVLKIKGLGRKFQPVERVKGQINNNYNDNNAIIGVLASSCLEGQHDE